MRITIFCILALVFLSVPGMAYGYDIMDRKVNETYTGSYTDNFGDGSLNGFWSTLTEGGVTLEETGGVAHLYQEQNSAGILYSAGSIDKYNFSIDVRFQQDSPDGMGHCTVGSYPWGNTTRWGYYLANGSVGGQAYLTEADARAAAAGDSKCFASTGKGGVYLFNNTPFTGTQSEVTPKLFLAVVYSSTLGKAEIFYRDFGGSVYYWNSGGHYWTTTEVGFDYTTGSWSRVLVDVNNTDYTIKYDNLVDSVSVTATIPIEAIRFRKHPDFIAFGDPVWNGNIIDMDFDNFKAYWNDYPMMDIRKTAQYRRVDDMIHTPTQVNQIISDTNADFIYQGFMQQGAIWQDCASTPAFLRQYCTDSRYSYDYLAETIAVTKAANPTVKFGGGLLTEFIDPNVGWDPISGQTYTRDDIWAMALDPEAHGYSMTKNEMQTWFARGRNWITDADMPTFDAKNDPRMKYYLPDPSNTEFKKLFLHFAQKQIDSGVDVMWLDMIPSASMAMQQITGDYNNSIVIDLYRATLDIPQYIHGYGKNIGKDIYVVTWARPLPARVNNGQEPPYDLDMLMFTISPTELNNGAIDDSKWDDRINTIRNKYFSKIPEYVRLDYGNLNSPLGVFSRMDVRDSNNFLVQTWRTFDEVNQHFIYPVHGGNLGAIGSPGAKLSYGLYDWYDSQAPEFDTYNTMLALMNNKVPADLDGWNNFTKDSKLNIYVAPNSTVSFSVNSTQLMYDWTWINATEIMGDGTNSSIAYAHFPSEGNYSLSVNGVYANGTSYSLKWDIRAGYDPSGIVKDSDGNPIDGAYVHLFNSTWDDPCSGSSSCYTGENGIPGGWNTNIYSSGIYNYTVSKPGYTPVSGFQEFSIGGTEFDFTLEATGAVLNGTVYEWTTGNVPYPVTPDLKEYNVVANEGGGSGLVTIPMGSTALVPESDYFWKLVDIDENSPRQAYLMLYYVSGSPAPPIGDCVIKEKETCSIRISEDADYKLYLDFTVESIFATGDSPFVQGRLGGHFKTKTTIEKALSAIFSLPIQPLVNWFFGNSEDNLKLWNSFGPGMVKDLNGHPVTAQNPCGGEFVSYATDRDFYGSALLTFQANGTYNILEGHLFGAAASGTRDFGYSVTDNDVEYPEGTLFPESGYQWKTGIGSSCVEDGFTLNGGNFTSLDQNGDKILKVWVHIKSGGSSPFLLQNLYFSAGCINCEKKPLPDASIRYTYNGFMNETTSNDFGIYSIPMPFGVTVVTYSKKDYQTKYQSFNFVGANRSQVFDVIINKTVSPPPDLYSEWINVTPNVITFGQSGTVNYRILNNWDYYRVVIQRFGIDENLEDWRDLEKNAEGYQYLPSLQPGFYVAFLQGSCWMCNGWTTTANANFTIRSNIPMTYWLSTEYYIGDTMKLGIDIPDGIANQQVTAYYPNGSLLYTQEHSSAEGIQTILFPTVNYTVNQNGSVLPPGKYLAKITGNDNQSYAELYNRSVDNYTLTAPDSVVWGTSFVFQYVSPKQSELHFIKSDGYDVEQPVVIQGSGSGTYNTSVLENKADTLTIKLVRNKETMKSKDVSITISTKGTVDNGQTVLNFFSGTTFVMFIILLALIVGGAMYGGIPGGVIGGGLSIPILYIGNMLPLWGVMLEAGVVFIAVALIVAGQVTKPQ